MSSHAPGSTAQHRTLAYHIDPSLSRPLSQSHEKHGGQPQRVGVSLDASRCRREAFWSGVRRGGLPLSFAGSSLPAAPRASLEAQKRSRKAGPHSKLSLRRDGDKEWDWPKSTNSGGLRPGMADRSEE